jgi:DUF917 family protein
MKITIEDVDDLARGAALLGAGGGGDPYIGGLMLRQALAKCGEIVLTDVADVADSALAIPVAMMGAPSVMVEKIPNGDEFEAGLRALERRLGRRADVLLCAEIGGVNALLPLILAARLGLPVVDGDGMGRAFPALQMVTYHVFGVRAAPMTLADEYSNIVTVEAADDREVERLARQVTVAMGGSALICLYSMSGADAKRCMVRGTISLALGLGRAIRTARAASSDLNRAVLEFLRGTQYYKHCRVLFQGKCSDVMRETRGGWTLGRLTVEGLGGWSGRALEIQFQNEHLVAREGGAVRAVVPDLIAVVDNATAEPITTEGLKYGQRVSVLGISCAPILRTPEALSVIGPAAFGLEVPWTPVEALNPE